MPKQPALPGLRDAMKKKQTRREVFLSEMDAVVPYVSAEREAAFQRAGKVWGVMRKAPKGGALHPLDERRMRWLA